MEDLYEGQGMDKVRDEGRIRGGIEGRIEGRIEGGIEGRMVGRIAGGFEEEKKVMNKWRFRMRNGRWDKEKNERQNVLFIEF